MLLSHQPMWLRMLKWFDRRVLNCRNHWFCQLLNDVDAKASGAAEHPGLVLEADFLETFHISDHELASKMGVDVSVVDDLVCERLPISGSLAIKLGKALDTEPEYWVELQRRYDHNKTHEVS